MARMKILYQKWKNRPGIATDGPGGGFRARRAIVYGIIGIAVELPNLHAMINGLREFLWPLY